MCTPKAQNPTNPVEIDPEIEARDGSSSSDDGDDEIQKYEV